jgi:phospholipid/cholesterol/gamma-HCH transport system substrate-binding protein
MVIGITILYLGFNYLKGIDFFSSSTKYYAVYNNINGLNVSNPVFINGFAVGRVSRIELLQPAQDKVLVELDLKGNVILGDSSFATLNSDFLGNKSILINTGDLNKPLESGDTLIAVLDKGITELLTESAQPVANSLESTIKKINAILDNLSGNSGKINSIMENIESTTRTLQYTIRQTGTNFENLSLKFQEVGDTLNYTASLTNQSLRNMSVFTDSLKRIEINKTLKEIDQAVAGLNEAINSFSTSQGTLGKLMNDDSLYVNLNQAAVNLNDLLIHFNENPKHFLGPLGKSSEKIEKDLRKQQRKEAREAAKQNE